MASRLSDQGVKVHQKHIKNTRNRVQSARNGRTGQRQPVGTAIMDILGSGPIDRFALCFPNRMAVHGF